MATSSICVAQSVLLNLFCFNIISCRYTVEGKLVKWQGWSFRVGLRSSVGMRLFDIRYKGERVAYEISLQQAMAAYGGNPRTDPLQATTYYLDSAWGEDAADSFMRRLYVFMPPFMHAGHFISSITRVCAFPKGCILHLSVCRCCRGTSMHCLCSAQAWAPSTMSSSMAMTALALQSTLTSGICTTVPCPSKTVTASVSLRWMSARPCAATLPLTVTGQLACVSTPWSSVASAPSTIMTTPMTQSSIRMAPLSQGSPPMGEPYADVFCLFCMHLLCMLTSYIACMLSGVCGFEASVFPACVSGVRHEVA